jgi:hypothetical protein
MQDGWKQGYLNDRPLFSNSTLGVTPSPIQVGFQLGASWSAAFVMKSPLAALSRVGLGGNFRTTKLLHRLHRLCHLAPFSRDVIESEFVTMHKLAFRPRLFHQDPSTPPNRLYLFQTKSMPNWELIT